MFYLRFIKKFLYIICMNYEFESWTKIKGRYLVSNYGRIKDLDWHQMGITKILKPSNERYGRVQIWENGNMERKTIHRLVAEAFIPNPWKLPVINHRDGNTHNNCVWNLEWCTVAYNNTYGDRLEKSSEKHKKKILQYTKEGVLVAEYDSIKEAVAKSGITKGTIIRHCKGKIKTDRKSKFIFKYAD